MNYYGRFYRSAMHHFLHRINNYVMRWAQKKYRRLRGFKRFQAWWTGALEREPGLFKHWPGPARSERLDEKSGVTGDCHAPFRGSPGMKFPGPPDLLLRSVCAA